MNNDFSKEVYYFPELHFSVRSVFYLAKAIFPRVGFDS